MSRGWGGAAGEAVGVAHTMQRTVQRMTRHPVRPLLPRSAAFFAWLVVALLCPRALAAQRVVGEVVRADSVTPAVRVLIEWRVGGGSIQRTSTDDAGRFIIVPSGTGLIAMRVLRPGFRPQVIPARLRYADQVESVRIVLRDEMVRLAPVVVREDRVCGERGEAIAWQLWEQARVMLQSVAEAARDTTLAVTAVEYESEFSLADSVRIRQSTIRRVGLERAQSRAHYDSLFRYGYIRRVADTSSYFSPTLAVITDDRFAVRYCFSRVADEEAHPDWIGVTFEPAVRPGPGISDVVGTFWLDRERLLLREVTYRYVNAPLHHRIEGIGGDLRFTELSSGHWILSDWEVRMPTLNAITTGDRAPAGKWAKRRIVYRVERRGAVLYADDEGARLGARAFDGIRR